MATGVDCCCESTYTAPVNIPGTGGPTGPAGADGTDGVNAFTTLTADFTIPAVGANASATVANNSWAAIGQAVFLSDGTDVGTFEVVSKTGTTVMSLQFLGVSGDSSPGIVINSGGAVSPAGHPSALSAALPNAMTDNSTGTASDTIAAGVGVYDLTIPHTFEAGAGAGEVVTAITIGHAFKILAWTFITDVPGVGAGASRVFNMEIGTTDVGTVVSTVTATEASTSAKGELTAGTAVSGANTGTAADTFSIEVAAGGTAFTAGSGSFIVRLQNMDSANAVASLADHVNDLITALT